MFVSPFAAVIRFSLDGFVQLHVGRVFIFLLVPAQAVAAIKVFTEPIEDSVPRFRVTCCYAVLV